MVPIDEIQLSTTELAMIERANADAQALAHVLPSGGDLERAVALAAEVQRDLEQSGALQAMLDTAQQERERLIALNGWARQKAEWTYR